jgi:hypothetical protein
MRTMLLGATVRIDNDRHRKSLADFVGQSGCVVAVAHDGQAFRLIVGIGSKLVEVGTWEVDVLTMRAGCLGEAGGAA